MNGRMKLMIAYDGSSYADDAIDDLPRAGLPRDLEILAGADFSTSSPELSKIASILTRRGENRRDFGE